MAESMMNVLYFQLPRCSVAVSALPTNDPVYLKVNGTALSLWNFDGPALEWDKDAGETALLCSGTGNVLEKSTKQLTKKTCSKGTVFKVEGADAEAKDLKCKEAVVGDILATTEYCGNHRGYLYRLGFNADTIGFITYIESCMNSLTFSVLYTKHVLPGAAIKSRFNEKSFYRVYILNYNFRCRYGYHRNVAEECPVH